MCRIDRQFERGIGDGAGFLRVEVLHQFGCPFDIGEQGGDGLALAIERSADRRFGSD
jgi:hypothetical protein